MKKRSKESDVPAKLNLFDLKNKKRKYVIGLNSGTSADGIDAALVRIDGAGFGCRVKLIFGRKFRFNRELSQWIKHCAQPEFDGALEWQKLNLVLAREFVRAAGKMIKTSESLGLKVDLIGSHGQTIRHLPGRGNSTITVQLGDPTRIAVAIGIPVVGDFRIADIAAGGQGAPLTPIANALLFGKVPGDIAILNIGGIANITVLKRSGSKLKIFGCDCGPGNMVIDHFAAKLFGKRYDKDGLLAIRGAPDQGIIRRVLARGFFGLKGPRSAGREMFGDGFCRRFEADCRRAGLGDHDILATAASLSAQAVFDCVELNRWKFKTLILTGGGARNRHLIAEIEKRMRQKIKFADEFGFPAEYLEAVSFAVFANEAVAGNRYDLSTITGAKKAVILGKICPA